MILNAQVYYPFAANPLAANIGTSPCSFSVVCSSLVILYWLFVLKNKLHNYLIADEVLCYVWEESVETSRFLCFYANLSYHGVDLYRKLVAHYVLNYCHLPLLHSTINKSFSADLSVTHAAFEIWVTPDLLLHTVFLNWTSELPHCTRMWWHCWVSLFRQAFESVVILPCVLAIPADSFQVLD